MKNIILFLFIFCFSHTVFAYKPIDDIYVALYYETIHKHISFLYISPEDIKHISIETSPNNVRYERKDGDNLLIYVKDTPTVRYYNNTIECHAGTLFFNGQGIEFYDSFILNKNGQFSLGAP